MERLKAESLGFAYGDKTIITGVSLAADPGEVVGIIGPNGSGKSTLLKCLAGLLECTGSVCYEGENISTLTTRERAGKRAYLGQSLTGEFNFSVEEVVAMGLSHRHQRYHTPTHHPDVQACLKEMELGDFGLRSVQNLSGGERQRALLARTFVQGAGLVFLDEPTSALDLKHQRQWLSAIQSRAAQGTTFFLVLHDLNLAVRACTRWVVLQNGKVVADDLPAKIVADGLLESVFETPLWVTEHPEEKAPLLVLRT